MRRYKIAEIQRAAAMRQPTHDDFIFRNDLLTINTQILARLMGAFRHHQAPSNQRRHIAWPAGLNRQSAEIDIVAFPHDVLARRARDDFRRHVEYLLVERQLVPGILQAFGWVRLFEKSQQLAHLAQRGHVVLAHTHRYALRRAEQIAQHRDGMACRFLEQNRRATSAQHAVAYFGHFQAGVYRHGHALQLALRFELGDKISQIGIFHTGIRVMLLGAMIRELASA